MTKKKEREAIRLKYGGRCSYCGDELTQGWHVDHLKPVIREFRYNPEKRRHECTGKMWAPERDTFENKMPSCPSCNINKHNLSIEQFRAFIADFPRTLGHRVTYQIAKRYGLIIETGAKVVFWFEKFESAEKGGRQ